MLLKVVSHSPEFAVILPKKKKELNKNPCQLTVRHRTAADDYGGNKLVKNMYMQGH